MKFPIAFISIVLGTNASLFAATLPVPVNPQEEVARQASVNQDAVPEDTRSDEERPEMGAIFKGGEDRLIVDSVFTNGPFHQTSIYSGDVIATTDGVEVKNKADIDRFLLNKRPGDVVTVNRIREGQSSDVSVKLMSRKKLYEVSNTREESTANISRQYVGGQSHASTQLIRMEQRLLLLENEIRDLRQQIDRLRNASGQ